MNNYDYIVVGAGIEGSSTAYQLAKNGYKTLLLEQFPLRHSRGSSHGGSRVTRKAYDKSLYTKMMMQCHEMWLDLEREYGQRLFLNTGLLLMAHESKNIITEYKSVMDSNNLHSELLKGPTLREKFPTLRDIPDSWEALFDPDGGVLLADKCLEAYHILFQKYGGTINDNEKVLEIKPKSDTVEILTEKYSAYRCKSIVLCLGAWSGKFIKAHLNLTLPLKPIAITVCYWKELIKGVYSAVNGFPTMWFMADDDKEYFICPSAEYPGLVKISYNHGPTVDPDLRDNLELEESVQKTSKIIQKYFPGADYRRPESAQTCLYTFTPDQHVILDRHPIYRNVIIGAGFSGHGFKLAPTVGRILSSLAINPYTNENQIGAYDLKEVSINRFNDKKSVKLRHML